MAGSSNVLKRALVAWDKACLPKAAGELNVIDVGMWNKAAVYKLFWNIAQKKDKLWKRWIHEYYVKGNNVVTMLVPHQASWVIKRIFNARTYTTGNLNVVQQHKFSVSQMYRELRGNFQKVSWRKMLCNNYAPPKCTFITWLQSRVVLLPVVTC